MHTYSRSTVIITVLGAFMLLAAACGGDPVPLTTPASAESAAAPAEAVTPSAVAATAASDFGDILVNAAGMSLYGFTDDVDGVSTCFDGCAGAWPPVLVDSAAVPAGLDAAVFSVVTRPDGTNQLKAGKWPLYLFAGDTAPGQTTGHLSGDVWFLARPDGSLVDFTPAATEAAAAPAAEPVAEPAAAPALASAADSELGEILVNGAGLTLYGFTNDVNGVPTCEGGCAEAWPPILVEGANLPADLDADLYSVVARPDGTHQLKAGNWPLYLFAGDVAAGMTTGHLSGDVWFVAASDGTLIDFTPAAAEPEAEAAVQAAPPAAIGSSDFGQILVNDAGLSIYGFANDVDGVSVCEGGCAEAWPPVLVPSDALPDGLDSAVFSVVPRPDGSYQLKAGKWPLYLFAGDTAPGQTTGHLSGDVWFLASPDGKLIGFAPPAAAAAAAVAPTAAPAQPAPAAPVPATPVPPTPQPVAPADPTPAPGYGSLNNNDGYGDSDY